MNTPRLHLLAAIALLALLLSGISCEAQGLAVKGSRVSAPRAEALGLDEAIPGPKANVTVDPATPVITTGPVLDGVQFIGNTHIPDTDLRAEIAEQLGSIKKEGVSAATADDAAFFTELYYQREGYAAAKVNYALHDNVIVITVDEGPVVALGRTLFVGNHSISSESLREQLIGPTRERFSRFKDNLPFIAEFIDVGISRIKALYESEGFPLATVVASYANVDNGAAREVTVHIVEGKRFHFGAVTFVGRAHISEAELRGAIADIVKQPYAESRVLQLQRKINDFYKEHGYFKAQATIAQPIITAETPADVRLVVEISEGIQYRFGTVMVSGLDRLRPGFLNKRFADLAGEVYSPEALDENYRAMIQTGIFDRLEITPQPQPDGTLPLDIKVKEAKARQWGFSAGFGSYDGILASVEYRDLDLAGTGRPLTAALEGSLRGLQGLVKYEDPWLFDSKVKFSGSIYALTKQYEEYTKIEAGIRPELSRKFGKHYEVGAFAQAKRVDITKYHVVIEELGPESYGVNSVGFSQTLDYRNDPNVPTKGFFINTTGEIAPGALGGDVKLARATYRAGAFIPIGPVTLALGAQGGVVVPLDGNEDDVLPIDERFFVGGANTVRSFTDRELSPRDYRGFFIGGEAYNVFNVELIFPIWQELKGAVFFDAGNNLSNASDFGFSDMRYAIGAGLRYNLPIGPVRLDYGYNPDREPNEDFGALHFSFGMAF